MFFAVSKPGLFKQVYFLNLKILFQEQIIHMEKGTFLLHQLSLHQIFPMINQFHFLGESSNSENLIPVQCEHMIPEMTEHSIPESNHQ